MFSSFQATDTSGEKPTEPAKPQRPSAARRITTNNACGRTVLLASLDHQRLMEEQDPVGGERYDATALHLAGSVSAEYMMRQILDCF
jgi:hypothetical protein